MQMWNVFYGTICQPVYASNHETARKLAIKHLANTLGAIDPDKVAVVDPNIACTVPSYKPVAPWRGAYYQTSKLGDLS